MLKLNTSRFRLRNSQMRASRTASITGRLKSLNPSRGARKQAAIVYSADTTTMNEVMLSDVGFSVKRFFVPVNI